MCSSAFVEETLQTLLLNAVASCQGSFMNPPRLPELPVGVRKLGERQPLGIPSPTQASCPHQSQVHYFGASAAPSHKVSLHSPAAGARAAAGELLLLLLRRAETAAGWALRSAASPKIPTGAGRKGLKKGKKPGKCCCWLTVSRGQTLSICGRC